VKCLNVGANFVKHVVCIAQIVVVAAGVDVNIYYTYFICDLWSTNEIKMQSHEHWVAIGAVTDMFEREPVRGTFDEWMSNAWNDFEKMCLQIGKHRYIMVTAERECKKCDEFDDAVEKARLMEMCGELGLEPHEFVEMAFNRYKIQCLKKD